MCGTPKNAAPYFSGMCCIAFMIKSKNQPHSGEIESDFVVLTSGGLELLCTGEEILSKKNILGRPQRVFSTGDFRRTLLLSDVRIMLHY